MLTVRIIPKHAEEPACTNTMRQIKLNTRKYLQLIVRETYTQSRQTGHQKYGYNRLADCKEETDSEDDQVFSHNFPKSYMHKLDWDGYNTMTYTQEVQETISSMMGSEQTH